MSTLVRRLVQNPHDEAAIHAAHQAGQSDPRAYAALLEQVGKATADPAISSHWLVEAATVWETTLSDVHSAVRALGAAFERDPARSQAGERLMGLFRREGDYEALRQLLTRRADALAALAMTDAGARFQAAALFEEAGRIAAEQLQDTAGAALLFRRTIEADPQSQYAIYALRELHKAAGEYREALPYFEMEQRLVSDSARKFELYIDEAEVCKRLQDYAGTLQALQYALSVNPTDVAAKAHLASAVLERYRAGAQVSPLERQQGGELFVGLAEQYPGEHGLAYALCGLELTPRDDRGMQLAIFYGEQTGRLAEVAPLAAAYLQANPSGVMAAEASRVAGDAAPPAAPSVAPESHSFQSVAGTEVDVLADQAAGLADKNRRNEAARLYRRLLELEPTHAEALAFLQMYLRRTRKFVELRDLLMKAAETPSVAAEDRLGWLKEAASLSETQLRDADAAIAAWRSIASEGLEEGAHLEYKRLLEKSEKWDELIQLLSAEVAQAPDDEVRISLEKSLAKIHESRRADPVAAGEAWARIAALSPGDETAIDTAVEMFEAGQRLDLAISVIADNVEQVEDREAKRSLLTRLGNLKQAQGDFLGAGDAYSDGAAVAEEPELWKAAEDCFVRAQAWEQAGSAAEERAQLSSDGHERAAIFARVAEYLTNTADHEGALLRWEQATELDPVNDDLAQSYESALVRAQREEDQAAYLLHRAERLAAPSFRDLRVNLRKRAASLQRDRLGDLEASRESLSLVLLDGDDVEALRMLADEAEARGEVAEAVGYLDRLAQVLPTPERVGVLLRQAGNLADSLGDVDAAVERYETVLRDLDPHNRQAFAALARLEEQRQNFAQCAAIVERHLRILGGDENKTELALKLAELYEERLDLPHDAMRALRLVMAADPDDFDAVQRLALLAETVEDWESFSEYYEALIGVEGDEEEVSKMTRRLADVLESHLQKPEAALNKLGEVADRGDSACRDAFVLLADKLGRSALVADKLYDWHAEAVSNEARTEALHSAFQRYVAAGEHEKAAKVAKLLARGRVAREAIGTALEKVGSTLADLDALTIAHGLMSQSLSGEARAQELVRQAELLARVGVPVAEAVNHGEQGLASIDPEGAQSLLARLSELAKDPEAVIALYERQVGRCKDPQAKLQALARAASVAAEHGAVEKARTFFDLALSGSADDATVTELRRTALLADEDLGPVLRRTLAESLAAGGQGARDGGRSKSVLLRRAAQMASEDMGDAEQAFVWLGEALLAHADDDALDALQQLATQVGDLKRIDETLEKTLDQVFDGPVVRKLLARRAELRAHELNDLPGAAADLKRLHDLSPADQEVGGQLAALFEQLADYRGLVQLYEDQLLRSRDQDVRAELSRKIAVLWRDRLDDPRETADAWRRVLRILKDDPEAKAELANAKVSLLKQRRNERPVSVADLSPALSESQATPEPREGTLESTSEPPGTAQAMPSAVQEEQDVTAPSSERAPERVELDADTALAAEAAESAFNEQTLAEPRGAQLSGEPDEYVEAAQRPGTELEAEEIGLEDLADEDEGVHHAEAFAPTDSGGRDEVSSDEFVASSSARASSSEIEDIDLPFDTQPGLPTAEGAKLEAAPGLSGSEDLDDEVMVVADDEPALLSPSSPASAPLPPPRSSRRAAPPPLPPGAAGRRPRPPLPPPSRPGHVGYVPAINGSAALEPREEGTTDAEQRALREPNED